MEKEVGKQIDGYPDYYVSNLGRVKSTKRNKECILKPRICKGYLRVELFKNGKHKIQSVHRLVANAFIPNITGMPCVNHRDENPYNNVTSNLEWCNVSYNINYGNRNSRVSKALLNRGDLSKPVKQLSLNDDEITIYPSIKEAVRITGIPYATIGHCCNNHIKNPKQYRGEYVDYNVDEIADTGTV